MQYIFVPTCCGFGITVPLRKYVRQEAVSTRKAMSSFFLIYYTLHDSLQNHALWIGFLVYLALRIIVQALLIARKDIG